MAQNDRWNTDDLVGAVRSWMRGELTWLQTSTVDGDDGDAKLPHTPARDVENKDIGHDGE
jgi:hypothetical protein